MSGESIIEIEEAREVLADVAWGSRLARGWLAGFAAHDTDIVDKSIYRPALFRTLLVEKFPTGYRFTSTDSYWVSIAWVGNQIGEGVGIWADTEDPPTRGELPEWSRSVVDTDYRIRDLMRWVRARTKKLDHEHPDIRLEISVRLDSDADVPRLDPSFDRTLVDVAIPGVERVAGHLNELDYPNVARIAWENDPSAAIELDQVQLNPSLLGKLAAAVRAVDSDGVRFHFHGDPAKPVSWEATHPASADLYGLVMPQRIAKDDDQ